MHDEEGDTPLTTATANGHSAVVNMLVEKGAAINLANNNGWTALMYAATEGSLEDASVLLKHGASVDKKLPGNKT
ncbi:Ankyrin repeat-containing domain [Phytophthora cactorum]|nr:Ankyrin repeat-containing domain [Phytophthora cactorum]